MRRSGPEAKVTSGSGVGEIPNWATHRASHLLPTRNLRILQSSLQRDRISAYLSFVEVLCAASSVTSFGNRPS